MCECGKNEVYAVYHYEFRVVALAWGPGLSWPASEFVCPISICDFFGGFVFVLYECNLSFRWCGFEMQRLEVLNFYVCTTYTF